MPGTITWRPEWIQDDALPNVNSNYIVNAAGGFPVHRADFGLRFQYEGRWATPGTNGPIDVLPGAPDSIIENVKLDGQRRIRGTRDPILNLRGAELRQLYKIWTGNPDGPIT